MQKPEIYSQLNKVFRDLFDDEGIELTPQTTAPMTLRAGIPSLTSI